MAKKCLVVQNLTKRFADTAAVKGVSFDVDEGEFFTLIGPSGSGKTTTLRCVAGLEKLDYGNIWIDGRHVTNLPTHLRGISLVFQNFALFPHRTVAQNIGFGLKMKGHPSTKIDDEVREIMRVLEIEGLGNKHPSELSRGQQQRVALARSLVVKPKLLLLDEPLGSLDYKLQQKMQIELKRLHEKLRITFLYVTHSQEQALTLADRMLVMNQGMIEQMGTPDEIYHRPTSVFVARFVGETNILEGSVESISDGCASVKTRVGEFTGSYKDGSIPGKRVAYVVRPENIFSGKDAKQYKNQIQARLTSQIYRGSYVVMLLELADGSEFKMVRRRDVITDISQQRGNVLLGWNPEDAVVLDKPSVVPEIDIDRVLLGA